MTQTDMVHNETYKGCLKVGCNESLAKNTAIEALQKYKNNQFTTVSKLIAQSITDAKKLIIKSKKAAK